VFDKEASSPAFQDGCVAYTAPTAGSPQSRGDQFLTGCLRQFRDYGRPAGHYAVA
jgi:hypothetical protein